MIFTHPHHQVEVEGVLGLICAIWAWKASLLLDTAARALLAQGRAESSLAFAAQQALMRHRTVCLCTDGHGRYVAEIETLPDVVATGATEEEARANARAKGFDVILGLIRNGLPFLPLT